MPIGVAKVDCMAQADLCREQKVMAFPTLRWYHSGKATRPDYNMDRTVQALMSYANRKLDMDDKFKEWHEKAKEAGSADQEEIEKIFYKFFKL